MVRLANCTEAAKDTANPALAMCHRISCAGKGSNLRRENAKAAGTQATVATTAERWNPIFLDLGAARGNALGYRNCI